MDELRFCNSCKTKKTSNNFRPNKGKYKYKTCLKCSENRNMIKISKEKPKEELSLILVFG